jgi:hypothetical protein
MPILGVIASSAKGAPAIPTIGTATDVGTARPFNNGAASVTFTANAGAAATSFTVKAYTTGGVYTGISGTGASSPVVVTGLASEGVYKYTVFATNAAGSSLESGFSNNATSTTIPAVPTIGTAACASGQAYTGSANVTAAFTAGGTGGKTVTYYATSSSGATGNNTTTPVTVSETVGNPTSTARTYTIVATNANGSSAASSASNSVAAVSVPQTPTISSATRSSNTVVSIAFSGATGGSAITAVTATSSPSISITSSGTSSPMTATGTYTQGVAYTFTITATNAFGTSSSSSASSSVTPYPLPTIGAFSVSTDYPTGSGRYVTGSSASTTNGIMFAGTDGQNSRSEGYYWNNTSWVALGTYPSAGQVVVGRTMNTGSNQIQVVSPGQAQSKTYYISGSGGSWSTGTDVPSNAPYTPIAFRSSNGVRIALGASPFTSYYRTGTGAWTSTTAAPVASDNSQSAADSGTINGLASSGATYTASLTGAWTAAANWNQYWTSGNTQNNMWTYYDNNGSGMYVWTTSGATYAGATIPLPAGFTGWNTMRMFGTSNGELHIATGRQTNPPDPSYPGVVTHYKATIT